MTEQRDLDELARISPQHRIRRPQFGDVIRIVWTTYYFGADDQWHNARTGAVEDAEILVEEVEKADENWTWLFPSKDVESR